MSEISKKEITGIVNAVMKAHIGPEYDEPIGEGGCPRISWYGLRNELVKALTEAAAHARAEAAGVKVKPLDAARLAEAESEITEYQRERSRWIDYTTDLQRIIEALCNRRALPEPVSTARHHYEMARSSLAHPAVQEGMVMVPREPTEAMLAAGHQQIDWCRDGQSTDVNEHPSQTEVIGGVACGTTCKQDLQDAWAAMIAAAEKEARG